MSEDRRTDGQPSEANRVPLPFMLTKLNIDTQTMLKIHPSSVQLSDDVQTSALFCYSQ